MRPRQQDDPHKRRPDITRARKYLNWEPQVYNYYIYNVIAVLLGIIERRT